MNDRVFFATCVQPLLILLYNEHCRTLSSFYGNRTLTARRMPPMALRVSPDQILSRPSQTANADGTSRIRSSAARDVSGYPARWADRRSTACGDQRAADGAASVHPPQSVGGVWAPLGLREQGAHQRGVVDSLDEGPEDGGDADRILLAELGWVCPSP